MYYVPLHLELRQQPSIHYLSIAFHEIDKMKKTLLAKQQPKRWFPAAERELFNGFLARRKKLKVSILWLTVTFRKLLEEHHNTDSRAAVFRPSFRWMQKGAKRHKSGAKAPFQLEGQVYRGTPAANSAVPPEVFGS